MQRWVGMVRVEQATMLTMGRQGVDACYRSGATRVTQHGEVRTGDQDHKRLLGTFSLGPYHVRVGRSCEGQVGNHAHLGLLGSRCL